MSLQSTAFATDWVRAKVGILILNDNQTRLAKSSDILQPGTRIQIHVIPEKNCYIYLINSDNQTATWLNWGEDQKQISQGEEKIFPSQASLYEQKAGGDTESFTIICSPKKLTEITQLFSTRRVKRPQWNALESKLIKNSRIPLGETLPKPFGIAGSVRALKNKTTPVSDSADPGTAQAGLQVDSKDMKIYSGNTMLVKKYKFNVKKP